MSTTMASATTLTPALAARGPLQALAPQLKQRLLERSPLDGSRVEADVREVIVAGHSNESGVEYLNPNDETEEPPPPAEGKKAPDPILLVQVTLTVTRAPEGESESERMKVVTFLPMEKEQGK